MWNVIRASVIGTSHTEHNIPCQDDCYADVITSPDDLDYLVCLVSDGAGSAKEGGKGAELACTTALNCIETTLQQSKPILDITSIEGWVINVQKAIDTVAYDNSLTARDYACTFLGAVISPSMAVFFQIGDGAIVASNGFTQGIVFWPQSGQYANMTNFITEEDALKNLNVSFVNSRIDEVALFSDGLQRLALSFEQRTPHWPFFNPMFSRLRNSKQDEIESLDEQLSRFLNSPQINERTDDDKSLVLATRLLPI